MTPAPAALAMFLPVDLTGSAGQAGIYEVFREVREKTPVVRGPAGVLAVLTHREVSGVLRDRRFGWGAAETVATHFGRDASGREVRQFIFMDPPDHTRIRSLVSKAFTARMVERLRSRVEDIAADMVRTVREKAVTGPVNLMATVADPLPALLLGELMGVPHDNIGQFQEWAQSIARGLDPDFMLTPHEISERQSARKNFDEYFGELAARRQVDPGDDLVSALVRAEIGEDRLSRIDLVTTCTLLLAAGYATTSNLIGNSVRALLSDPEQLSVFRANLDQTPAMMEELHRFDPPVQMVSRTALAPTEIDGNPVAAGEPVLLVIGAANRDPAVYDDPDRLDLTRRSDRQLGFGLGIHHCVGAPLARLSAQVAVQALTTLDLTLVTPEPAYTDNLIMRGLRELPVTLQGRNRS